MLLRTRPKQGISVFQAVVLSLVGIVLALVLAGLTASFGLNIQGGLDDSFCDGFYNESGDGLCYTESGENGTVNLTQDWNASDNFKSGITNLSDQAPNIGLVSAAVVIITLLVVGFGGLALSKKR